MRFEIVFAKSSLYDGSASGKTPFHAIIWKARQQMERAVYDEWLKDSAEQIRLSLIARFKREENPDGKKWDAGPRGGWRSNKRSARILFRSGLMEQSFVLTKIQRTSISMTNEAMSPNGYAYPAKHVRFHPEWNWWQPADKDIDEAADNMRTKIENAFSNLRF